MAITIPVNNIPATPMINLEEFRVRVADYAAALLEQMIKAEMTKSKQTGIKYHTSSRISALSLRGGKKVAADIDESEALYLEKYADSVH